MSTILNARVLVALLLAVMLMSTAAPAVLADGHMVDVTVMHRINGERLDLARELPVDVCIYEGGALLDSFTFGFPDKVNAELPAGEYKFDVVFAGAGCDSDVIMSAGPAALEAGMKVKAMAMLDQGTPVLKVQIQN